MFHDVQVRVLSGAPFLGVQEFIASAIPRNPDAELNNVIIARRFSDIRIL